VRVSQQPSDPTPDDPPTDEGVDVFAADNVDDELVEAFARLIPQLSSSPPPNREVLTELVDNPSTVLFMARVDGVLLGSLTLAFYRIPTGLKAWIEDVVVDTDARGRGVGALLNRAALDEARRRGAKDVSLTSRPSREAANRLYLRLGFVARETNMYRFSFD
jgi:ribosomal protein S18 acetylase RimI-like enzyme